MTPYGKFGKDWHGWAWKWRDKRGLPLVATTTELGFYVYLNEDPPAKVSNFGEWVRIRIEEARPVSPPVKPPSRSGRPRSE